MMIKFAATICKLGINPVVDPPQENLDAIFEQAGRSKGPIPVRGLIDGAEYSQTLVKYRGKWRLYINGEMLGASGLKAGDRAKIEIEYDPRPRTYPIPKELQNSLDANPNAKAAYDALPASRQTDILRYLGSLKTKAALVRNVEKVVRQLLHADG
jgi:Bacteriocin-protection, YdeI or OmpD-Associated/Domain of unknown function (DUF1905)